MPVNRQGNFMRYIIVAITIKVWVWILLHTNLI